MLGFRLEIMWTVVADELKLEFLLLFIMLFMLPESGVCVHGACMSLVCYMIRYRQEQ